MADTYTIMLNKLAVEKAVVLLQQSLALGQYEMVAIYADIISKYANGISNA